MTFTPSGVTVADWGSFQIVFDGVDITYFRGIRTLIDKMSFGEPYGEQAAQITLPSVTEYDAFSGSLSWLKPGRNVDIFHVMPDGTTIYPYWHGFAASIHVASGVGIENSVSVQLSGALAGEAALRVHQPQFLDTARDIGTSLNQCLNVAAYSRPLVPMRFKFQAATTGIETRKRGSRTQTVLEYCDEMLALAQGPGGVQWTIARAFTTDYPTDARSYYLRPKTVVATNTITAGGRGIALDIVRDITEHANAIYGEGVAPSGERWRHAKYPNLGKSPKPAYPGLMQQGDTDADFSYDAVTVVQAEMRSDAWPAVQITGTFDDDTLTAVLAVQDEFGLSQTGIINSATWDVIFDHATGDTALSSGYFSPLARRSAVDKYLYYGDGSVKGLNPNYDPNIMRVENIISYGEGIGKPAAITNAERILTRDVNTGDWAGTITLTSDPEERSRLDIREGSVITVKHLLGQGATGLTPLYVQGIEIQPEAEGMPVILTVDMKQYDLLALNARLSRNREAKRDPARSIASMRNRTSKPMKDAVGWDAESGAGIIRPQDIKAGWNVVKFVGAQYGNVEAIDATVYSPAQKFCIALFGAKVSRSILNSLVPDPLVMDTEKYGKWNVPTVLDSLEKYGFVEAWGDEYEPAGYYPGRFSEDHAVTGRLVDSLGWSFGSFDPPFLWLAIWVPNGGSRFKATMRVSIEDQS